MFTRTFNNATILIILLPFQPYFNTIYSANIFAMQDRAKKAWNEATSYPGSIHYKESGYEVRNEVVKLSFPQ